MTTQHTTSLASWLLDRIAEDEAVARAAMDSDGHRWVAEQDWTSTSLDWTLTTASTRTVFACCDEAYHDDGRGIGVATEGEVRHIARHDPARVLAQCAAYRRIVELHYDADGKWDHACDVSIDYPADHWPFPPWPCAVLRALASIYASEPGFREEWRDG